MFLQNNIKNGERIHESIMKKIDRPFIRSHGKRGNTYVYYKKSVNK